jgi:hypothetical protein
MSTDSRDVVLGLVAGGMRVGFAAGRTALVPARLASQAPLLGPPLQRVAADLAHEGALLRARARVAIEETAEEVLVSADLDRIIANVLEHEVTERALERALASPALVRLVVQVLESRFLDELTERVLSSPEMDRVVAYIATSPHVAEAVTQHTQTLAEEMVEDVRRRTHGVDDLAERAVRGWFRRPRPATP